MSLDENNYGGWLDTGGNNFQAPRRFYYCVSCFAERFAQAEAEKRKWLDIRRVASISAIVFFTALLGLCLLAQFSN